MTSLGKKTAYSLLATILIISRFPASCQVAAADHTFSSKYRILRRLTLPGSERGGHIYVDGVGRRAYFARDTRITVFDIDSGQVVGDIGDIHGVQDLGLAPDLHRAFAPSATNRLSILDLRTLRFTGSVHIPKAPWSNLAYDPASQRVFVLTREQSIVAVSAAQGVVLGRLDLVDVGESATADSKGNLYVVLADPAELAVIDSAKLALKKRIQLAPCVEPREVAMNQYAQRVFVTCSNGFLLVVDPDRNLVVARIRVGVSAGDVVFDDDLQLIFTSDEEGRVAMVRQQFPDKYPLVGSVATGLGPSTIALDQRTHRIFVAPVESVRTAAHPRSFVVSVAVLGYSRQSRATARH